MLTPAPPTAPIPRSKPVLYFFLGIVLFTLTFGVVALIKSPVSNPKTAATLLVYGAAGLKAPLETIAAEYHRATGVRIDLSLGGSQTLLANIQITQRGDLYLPADESYLDLAREKNLIGETFSLARQTVVIAVARGNPKRLLRLTDCTNASITLAQASPETAAVGKRLRAATERTGLWLALSNRTSVQVTPLIEVRMSIR